MLDKTVFSLKILELLGCKLLMLMVDIVVLINQFGQVLTELGVILMSLKTLVTKSKSISLIMMLMNTTSNSVWTSVMELLFMLMINSNTLLLVLSGTNKVGLTNKYSGLTNNSLLVYIVLLSTDTNIMVMSIMILDTLKTMEITNLLMNSQLLLKLKLMLS